MSESTSRHGRATSAVRAGLAVLGCAAAVLVMLRLSVWQWHRGEQRRSLQNYSYAVEWFAFAGLSVVGVLFLIREGWRTGRPAAAPAEPPAPGLLVGPPLRPGEDLEELTYLRLLRRLGFHRRR